MADKKMPKLGKALVAKGKEDEDEDSEDLEGVALDLLQAIKSKNVKGLAEALRAAIRICK